MSPHSSGMLPPMEIDLDSMRTTARLAGFDWSGAELEAFITVCGEQALAVARTAEAELMAGRAAGPLHGVPYGPKDLYNTKGVRTTGGSRILADAVPTEDSTVVARLAAAGLIVLGKLNMHEFAYGPEGLNAHYGDALNPWDGGAHRVAGGSSSGSGVAVAAALAPAALGSDTGGSIRIPASLCGISGLKPTYGRVSRAGVLPLAWSMDHAGPMARMVADCALMLRAMAGYDPADPTTSVLPVPDYMVALTGDVKGLRVGLLRAHFTDVAAPEVRDAVLAAVKTLERAGAVVDEVSLAHVAHVAAASFAIVATEALAYHAEWLRTRASDYQPDVRVRLHHERPPDRHADRRAALRRGDRAPRGRRLPALHGLAHAAPGARVSDCGERARRGGIASWAV